jgi:ABC-type branched-subunit amino acid transport system ATPase component
VSALLEVRGLVRRFGGLNAVDGVDLDVNEGEILSVIGPNGAGKTTLFNVVTGLYVADEGSIHFDGHDLVGLQPNHICTLGIARTFQTVRLFPAMTVLENTMVGQHCRTRSGMLRAIVPTLTHSSAGITPSATLSAAALSSSAGVVGLV